MFDEMTLSELEAFAADLHAQINRGQSERAKIALEDVKSWIAARKKEAESCSELPFFVNPI